MSARKSPTTATTMHRVSTKSEHSIVNATPVMMVMASTAPIWTSVTVTRTLVIATLPVRTPKVPSIALARVALKVMETAVSVSNL